MQAVAARYSGNFDPDGPGPEPQLPAAQAEEVWNEANSSDWLTPQYEGKTAVGVERYRQMLNASFKSIKSVNPNMLVLAGGHGAIRRQAWRGARPACSVLAAASLRAPEEGEEGKETEKEAGPDKWLHRADVRRPLPSSDRQHRVRPVASGPMAGDASTPDLGKIVQVLRGAEKAKTVSGHHPVWVTEFWWDTKPPNAVGAPLQTQARWIEQSLYLFWKAGASTAINFQIDDATTRPDAHAGYQAGVYFNDGRPKPSLTAFRFPFVTERVRPEHPPAWGKSPEAGKLKIQRRQGSRWVTVRSLSVSKGGTFQATLRLSGKQQLRATVGSSQSLIWKQAAFGTGGSDGGGPGAALIILLVACGVALVVLGGSRIRRRQIARQRRPRPARLAEPLLARRRGDEVPAVVDEDSAGTGLLAAAVVEVAPGDRQLVGATQ